MYEVYEQDIDNKESTKVSRYYTNNKKTAFMFMQQKNQLAQKNIWRVAMTIDDRICFDIDIPEKDNLEKIYTFYYQLFNTGFKVIKTLNGYHLISAKKYDNKTEWEYDICRVLNPTLKSNDVYSYKESIKAYAKQLIKLQAKLNENKQEFLDFYNEELRKSKLYKGVGIFDLYFCTNVIVRGHYCIRISKKNKDDKPYEIDINSIE